MAAELGSAFISIIPKAPNIKNNITNLLGPAAESGGSAAGGNAGSALLSKLKGVVTVAAVGKIIKDETIAAFPRGILNIHPSLLPKYRGTTPIESALLNNDKETGVSVMRLAHDMDAGNILAQESIQITPETTKQTLYESLATTGAKLLIAALPGALAGKTNEKTQDDSAATFTKPLNKSMSQLDLAKPAQTLWNEIRAFAGFPKSKTTILNTPCTITEAHISDKAETAIDLLCSDGKYLIIDRLIPENSKPMDAKSFLNGHK